MSRWIDADALIAQYKGDVLTAQVDYAEGVRDVIEDIKTAPSIDIVRCKECKHAHLTYDGSAKHCDKWKDDDDFLIEVYLDADFFCADGERRE